jgi:periplasmic divalent cation tolerance protein
MRKMAEEAVVEGKVASESIADETVCEPMTAGGKTSDQRTIGQKSTDEGVTSEGRATPVGFSAWRNSEFAVVISTAAAGDGDRIARELVLERLVACASVLPVKSHFYWDGTLQQDNEEMIVAKTAMQKAVDTVARIKELHTYQVPEVIVLQIVDGDEAYLGWIKKAIGL